MSTFSAGVSPGLARAARSASNARTYFTLSWMLADGVDLKHIIEMNYFKKLIISKRNFQNK